MVNTGVRQQFPRTSRRVRYPQTHWRQRFADERSISQRNNAEKAAKKTNATANPFEASVV